MHNSAYVYIDGFNLYYGAVKDKPYLKWLDLVKFSENIFPDKNVKEVKYFTAIVKEMGDHKRPERQNTYLRALKILHKDRIKIIKGNFRTNSRKFPIAKLQYDDEHNSFTQERIWVIRTEEKGTDVNLAVHLVNDAWKNLYDIALVISNDTDLAEAIRIAKKNCVKIIIIANPHIEDERVHIKLRRVSSKSILIQENLLKECQLPDNIPGTNIHRPDEWK